MARIFHADLYRLRKDKYDFLNANDVSTTAWTEISPQSPFFLFVPQNTDLLSEYEAGWKVPDVFNQNGDPAPGIVTTHDEFAISWSADEAAAKVERLLATGTEQEARGLFRLCSQDQWQYARAKSELQDGAWRKEITPLLYRPFDTRWTIFNRNVAVHRRERVMHHMMAGKNLGLIVNRHIRAESIRHTWVTGGAVDLHIMETAHASAYVLPLYLYPPSKSDLFNLSATPSTASSGRRPNLAPEFVSDMAARLGLTFVPDGKGDRVQTFGPEDVFDYLYAVFHSPEYRRRYAEFLKIDFPRLPLTRQPDLFGELCALGSELVALHLLEKTGPDLPTFPESGDNVIENVRYEEAGEGRVYINKTQHFAGVPAEVWNFHVGGYQVCHKWLKDRKGRALSFDDLQHYRRVVGALGETMRLMARIDETIAARGGWPLT